MQINPSNAKRAREGVNLSLDQLAEKSGLNRQTLHRIENEPPKNRRARTVEQLAEALGLSVTELCGPDLDAPSQALRRKEDEARAQMNVRIPVRIRNAYSLLAVRYGIKANQIIQIAPFLFLWAAERSLERRRKQMDRALELEEQTYNALPEYMRPAFRFLDDMDSNAELKSIRANDLFDSNAELKSIRANDLFGSMLAGETIGFEELDDLTWDVPMAEDMRNLVNEMPEGTSFDDWWLHGDPQYEICRADAEKWLGGDKAAAEHLVAGRVAIQEIPDDLIRGEGAARASWVNEIGDHRQAEAKARFEAQFGSIDWLLDEQSGEGDKA